jgi:hypothetical protein
MKQEHVDTVKTVADGLSVMTVVGTLMQVLPAVAALFTIIWTGLRIIEMITGKEISVLLGLKSKSHAD